MNQSLKTILEKRGIITTSFPALDEEADLISFGFQGLKYVAPAMRMLETEGVVLPSGEILHFEWYCFGIEKVLQVGNVIPTVDPVDAARKMGFGLAKVTGFDPDYRPDPDELAAEGLFVLIRI